MTMEIKLSYYGQTLSPAVSARIIGFQRIFNPLPHKIQTNANKMEIDSKIKKGWFSETKRKNVSAKLRANGAHSS